jgi:hypothetical protein
MPTVSSAWKDEMPKPWWPDSMEIPRLSVAGMGAIQEATESRTDDEMARSTYPDYSESELAH